MPGITTGGQNLQPAQGAPIASAPPQQGLGASSGLLGLLSQYFQSGNRNGIGMVPQWAQLINAAGLNKPPYQQAAQSQQQPLAAQLAQHPVAVPHYTPAVPYAGPVAPATNAIPGLGVPGQAQQQPNPLSGGFSIQGGYAVPVRPGAPVATPVGVPANSPWMGYAGGMR